ncbi:MAG: hypothetical protein JRK53_11070 [Deltaproteobacteria bacterium]|nr:hypothetical protein [Deltaproteobacteria bacterium]
MTTRKLTLYVVLVWTEITARSIYTEGVSDLAALKRDLEHALREKLVIKADVRLVPEGTLPRFEAKANLIKKCYP